MKNKKPKECGIYGWFNLIVGTVLVGQTGPSAGFNQRKSNYLSGLRRGKYGNKTFQLHWDVYDEDSFEFRKIEVLDNPSDDLLTEREQYWVDYYRALPGGVYNQVGPVNAPNRGREWPEELKERWSESRMGEKNPQFGKPLTQEHKDRLSEFHTGLKASEEAKENMSKARSGPLNHNFGKPMPQEQKDKLSASRTGMRASQATKDKMSATRKGVPKSQEHKDKIGDAHRGRPSPHKGKKRGPLSPEKLAIVGAKISASKKGKPGHKQTEVSKQLMSEIKKKWWADKKAAEKLLSGGSTVPILDTPQIETNTTSEAK